MNRKTSIKLANAFIAGFSIFGGLFVADHLLGGNLFPAAHAATSATPSPGSSSTTPADKTVQSDAVNYQYGTVQVEVVRKAGKISAVNMIQAGATAGRDQAFSTLVQAAISSQGSNFGNLSGATFTTQAFKQALDSAISKLG
jgi:uncharacterized protein with FMN-binding domain